MVDPTEALARSVSATYAMVAYLRAHVSDLTGEDGPTVGTLVWVDVLQAWEQLHAQVSTAALRAGLEARQVQLAERHPLALVEVIRAVLVELGVADHPDVMQVVGRQLRAVAGPLVPGVTR